MATRPWHTKPGMKLKLAEENHTGTLLRACKLAICGAPSQRGVKYQVAGRSHLPSRAINSAERMGLWDGRNEKLTLLTFGANLGLFTCQVVCVQAAMLFCTTVLSVYLVIAPSIYSLCLSFLSNFTFLLPTMFSLA